ncbi:hypothetical protein PS15m_003010 [Mucor circinelloides]
MEDIRKVYVTTRPDIIIICYKGIEVGCGEVRPPKKTKELIEIDRARIAEICKRQLHLLRLHVSSSTKEDYCTFGILFGGMTMEFSKLQFEAGKYDYSILKTIDIPDPNQSDDGSVEKTLEDMHSFKKMIEESLPAEEEEQSSFAFDQYSEVLKSTVRFLKST